MKLVILSTPGGQTPAFRFELDDVSMSKIMEATDLYPFTLTSNDDDSQTAFSGYHSVNRIAYLLLDTDANDPAITSGIEIESINSVFRHPTDFAEVESDFDYPTDINEMSDEEIISRTIRTPTKL